MTYASRQQILAALEALTEKEHAMLLRGARSHLWRTGFSEPSDLLHELIARLLAGARNWPLHMGFGPFLQVTMEAMAKDERGLARNRPGAKVDLDEVGGELARRMSLPSTEELQSRHQQEWLAVEAAREARAQLSGDADAQAAIDAMVADMTVGEACAAFGIQPKSLAAARKRAKRAIRRCAIPLFGPREFGAAIHRPGGLHD